METEDIRRQHQVEVNQRKKEKEALEQKHQDLKVRKKAMTDQINEECSSATSSATSLVLESPSSGRLPWPYLLGVVGMDGCHVLGVVGLPGCHVLGVAGVPGCHLLGP